MTGRCPKLSKLSQQACCKDPNGALPTHSNFLVATEKVFPKVESPAPLVGVTSFFFGVAGMATFCGNAVFCEGRKVPRQENLVGQGNLKQVEPKGR